MSYALGYAIGYALGRPLGYAVSKPQKVGVGVISNAPVLSGLDFAYLAQPFVYVPAKSSISVLGLDYSYEGQPFATNG